MKVEVFLKVHRMDQSGIHCLRYWCDIFDQWPITILCDHYDQETESPPDVIQRVLRDYPDARCINSDRSWVKRFKALKSAKRNMASANMTGFITDADAFWMIDADDISFLTYDYDLVRNKLKQAEQILHRQGYDAFSLDFYRNLNNGWTFGVALLDANIDQELLTSLRPEDIVQYETARNIDSVFDVLGKRGDLRLANFVFDGLAFQHLYNNYPDMPHGIYKWEKGRLWDKPLQPDVHVI